MTEHVVYGAFPAMSTSVNLTGVGVSATIMARATDRARRLAETWEERFSRFRPGSALCRLNAAGGQPVALDETFRHLLEATAQAVWRTEGRFDPAVLPVLEGLGYDRSIDEVRAGQAAMRLACGVPHRSGLDAWSAVHVDHRSGTVSLPVGMRIDLGGIAKGAFVDLLAAEFAHWPGGCIDAGGDAVVWGDAPDGRTWHIGVEHPRAPEADALVVEVPAASRIGVATSGTHRRRWQAEGHELHHLIDPRTSYPVQGDVWSVTALAESVTDAEVAAKAVLLAAAAPPVTDLFGASVAVLITGDGRVDLLQETQGNVHVQFLTAAGRAA